MRIPGLKHYYLACTKAVLCGFKPLTMPMQLICSLLLSSEKLFTLLKPLFHCFNILHPYWNWCMLLWKVHLSPEYCQYLLHLSWSTVCYRLLCCAPPQQLVAFRKRDSLTELDNTSFRENNCVKQQQYAQFKATVRMKWWVMVISINYRHTNTLYA